MLVCLYAVKRRHRNKPEHKGGRHESNQARERGRWKLGGGGGERCSVCTMREMC